MRRFFVFPFIFLLGFVFGWVVDHFFEQNLLQRDNRALREELAFVRQQLKSAESPTSSTS